MVSKLGPPTWKFWTVRRNKKPAVMRLSAVGKSEFARKVEKTSSSLCPLTACSNRHFPTADFQTTIERYERRRLCMNTYP
ncbi:hypothetical protein NDU88_001200 [Pleurodeles waltl]|uniref:Uncharacterized protein n=1 Tax=Pleurodeles waltl TaxID=8319 RepID=A0AAV7L8T8_PLEWA|nr:hypothetical protein NDU88_001200 [Pleurodeles waltl]